MNSELRVPPLFEPKPGYTYVGIVGHEAAKFTERTETAARAIIRELLREPTSILVSGACPLGGIDIWAEEEADGLGREKLIFPPLSNDWATGFKPRNERIARHASICFCIVVAELPASYTGRQWSDGDGVPYCYHCKGRNPPHVKSGGCWTAWRCQEQEWLILR